MSALADRLLSGHGDGLVSVLRNEAVRDHYGLSANAGEALVEALQAPSDVVMLTPEEDAELKAELDGTGTTRLRAVVTDDQMYRLELMLRRIRLMAEMLEAEQVVIRRAIERLRPHLVDGEVPEWLDALRGQADRRSQLLEAIARQSQSSACAYVSVRPVYEELLAR
jgi:hypothetical protein